MENPIHIEPHPRGCHMIVPLAASTATDMEPVMASKKREGDVVTITKGSFRGHQFMVEDWWDRLGDYPWSELSDDDPPFVTGHRLCMEYGRRVNAESLPNDDEVVYGNIQLENRRGKPIAVPVLVHASEIGD